MSMDYSQPRLDAIYAELRYRPFKVADLRLRIAQALEGRFPHELWQGDSKTLRLQSPDGSHFEVAEVRCAIGSRSDGPTFHDFFHQLQTCVDLLATVCNVQLLDRAGIRAHVSYAAPSADEAVQAIRQSLFGVRNSQLRHWGQGPARVEVAFSMLDDRFHYDLRFLPALVQRGQLRIDSVEAQPQVLEEQYVVAVDVDTSMVGCEVADIPALIDQVNVAISDKLPGFMRDLQRG